MAQAAFVVACANGDLARAKAELTKPGVHVDHGHGWRKYTALGRACTEGHLPVVRWLIEDAGACINITERDGNTPFWFACWYGQLNVAKYLTTRGADVHRANRGGQTPFWAACRGRCLATVRWLAITVGVGGDVTRTPIGGWAKGITPLVIARTRMQSAVASWLAPFLMRRVLIAYWSVGRERRRRGIPCPGRTLKATVWPRLPREALADVLLLLGPR